MVFCVSCVNLTLLAVHLHVCDWIVIRVWVELTLRRIFSCLWVEFCAFSSVFCLSVRRFSACGSVFCVSAWICCRQCIFRVCEWFWRFWQCIMACLRLDLTLQVLHFVCLGVDLMLLKLYFIMWQTGCDASGSEFYAPVSRSCLLHCSFYKDFAKSGNTPASVGHKIIT